MIVADFRVNINISKFNPERTSAGIMRLSREKKKLRIINNQY